MGDECTCEQCRGRGERAAGAGRWPISLTEAGDAELSPPEHECLLVVGKRGISIRPRPPEPAGRARPQRPAHFSLRAPHPRLAG